MSEILRIPYSLFRPLYERTNFHKSVIEELPDDTLKSAYAHCRSITRHYAKTFYMATRFLPNEKQRSIFAIYGLCRYLDNLVDDTIDLISFEEIEPEEINDKLSEFKDQIRNVYEGGWHSDPIMIAFADTLRKYNIPIDLPFLMIDGVRTDLYKNRFRTFNEVYEYSYKVASVVGLMTSRIFGYDDDNALEYAIDLGIAMQLTNILRDVGEDLGRNRIYIPQEDMEKFGITEKEMFNKKVTPEFRKLMEFQIERTRFYYQRADRGIQMLAKDSQLPVYLARYNYGRILDKIEENDYDVFSERAYLNSVEKFTILPRIFVKMQKAS